MRLAGAADFEPRKPPGQRSSACRRRSLKEVVTKGWSAKKQILGKDVFTLQGEKIGTIDDLIVAPDKSISYAIVGVGGFLGVASHDVAVPVKQFKQQAGRFVLPGATKETLQKAPKFEYATK